MKFDFQSQDDEIRNSDLLQLNLRAKNVKGKKWRCSGAIFGELLERVCVSL